ncbi:hypothetical protein PIB30_083006, partial [Stylosanthes scabra]|nr:hypothetical protein [Stylosanthes scabra]
NGNRLVHSWASLKLRDQMAYGLWLSSIQASILRCTRIKTFIPSLFFAPLFVSFLTE